MAVSWELPADSVVERRKKPATEASRHQQATLGTDSSDDDDTGKNTLKLSLQTSRRTAQAEAAVYATCLVPRVAEVCKTGKKAGRKYHEWTTGKSEHGHGPPHLCIGVACFDCLVKNPPENPSDEIKLHLAIVTRLVTHLRSLSAGRACRILRQWVHSESYDKLVKVQQDRFSFAIRGCELLEVGLPGTPERRIIQYYYEDSVIILLEAVGAELKAGARPPNDLERKVWKSLRALLGK